MAKEFKLPDPGEGIHEAEILEIYVSAGDEVEEGDIILHIETDKAAVEIPSPWTGTVEEIRIKPGDIVEVGEVLMTFRDGTGTSAGRTKPPVAEKEPQESADAGEEKGDEREAATAAEQEAQETEEQTQYTQPHGQEKPDTGKGRREKETHTEEAAATERESPEQSQEKETGDATRRTTPGPVPASPSTRRLARELEVDLHVVAGSGPGNRVTADDVRKAAGEEKNRPERGKAPEKEEAAEAKPTAAGRKLRLFGETLPPLPDFSRWGPVEQVPLRSIRRATARRMALAWSQIPHVTHQDVADITELEAFRRRHLAAVEEQSGKLSLMVFVMQAVVAGLKQFPRFNASLDPEAGELILKQYYHIGVAVDTEHGLIVPVIRDVDRKSLTELATELTELIERVRQGKGKPEDMRGGTFTITNPGPIGGTAFTPIINYPEVAILGLARAGLEPVVEGDLDNFTIVPRLRLPLHLAFDHRVNDGADAARFLRTIIDILSDPESFILNV
ncbi:MAG: 2-oxo acid dehydrogenase subunit E2 [Candidatus Binatia bacterium]